MIDTFGGEGKSRNTDLLVFSNLIKSCGVLWSSLSKHSTYQTYQFRRGKKKVTGNKRFCAGGVFQRCRALLAVKLPIFFLILEGVHVCVYEKKGTLFY